eukprot:6639760-Pyramimonas_sp.AAC.1
MDEFRQCVEEVALNAMVLKVGDPPDAAEMYTRLALRSFLPGKGNVAFRRLVLYLLPSADWRDDSLVCYVSSAEAALDQSNRSHIASALATALCQKRFSVWRRDKWTGCEEAVCEQALVASCGGILEDSYRLWASRQLAKDAKCAPGDHADGDPL